MIFRWRTALSNLSNNLSKPKQAKAIRAFTEVVIVTSLIVTSSAIGIRKAGGMEGFELAAYDRLMRLRPELSLDDRLLVVGISEADIQTRREYPIKDGTLAQVLAILQSYQPRVIGVDIARDVPQDAIQGEEWNSLKQQLEQLVRETRQFLNQGIGQEQIAQQLNQLEAFLNQGTGRQAMTQQFAAGDNVISACVLSSVRDPGLPPAPGTPPERVGFADLPRDPNGIIRRAILVSVPAAAKVALPSSHICNDPRPDNYRVSLSLSLAMFYLQADGIELTQNRENDNLQLGAVEFKPLGEQVVGYQNTEATDYQILLNYRSANQAVRVVNLTDVLEKRVDPAWIKDKVVLIGYSSDIAKDNFYTPFSGNNTDRLTMPGAVIHAQITSQIISAALGERSLLWYWSDGAELWWIFLWSLVGGAIAYFAKRIWYFVLAEGLALGLLYSSCYFLFIYNGWIPLVPPMLTLITSAVGVVLLDRASKSGYAQAIYDQVKDQVKGVLKPNIEIDEERRAKQVAEITESGYFQDLVARAKEIREKRAKEEAEASKPLS
jgi:CHASE2 domain-containing sensor protein